MPGDEFTNVTVLGLGGLLGFQRAVHQSVAQGNAVALAAVDTACSHMVENVYLLKLSGRQKFYLAVTLAASATIVALGVVLEPKNKPRAEHHFTVDMTIREIAPGLKVTGQALAREFGLSTDVPKNKPVSQLGVVQDQLDNSIAHLLSHRSTLLKYYVFAALVLFGLVFLVRLGRPDNASLSERRARYPRALYVLTLLVSVAVCGFALGKSPNPMEAAVKVLKAMAGLYPSVAAKLAALGFFLILTIIGDKLICGWACPLGAIQELIYTIPVLRRLKRWTIPFWMSNAIRGGMFVMMLLLLFGIVVGKKGFVLYHGLNAFNLFDLEFDTPLILATVIVTLALSLFLYRPFCHLICPFGLVSWLVAWLSLARVRIDRMKCNKCGACVQACPSEAAKGIVEGKVFRADCFSCARCLNVCPQDSIWYGVALRATPSEEKPELDRAPG